MFEFSVKNSDGSVERVKGKQSALADVFSTAWSKGYAEIEVKQNLKFF